ncbi:MAG: NAD(P)(+) transhydrogenase (Re/Si-specific) subunit beta [Ginsengibacter sp.]
MGISILSVCYLIASVTFIIGLKMLSNPNTARRGNLIAAGGMIIAITATIFLYKEDGKRLENYGWIFSAIAIGSIIGFLIAKKVKMTAMPELVSFFNGMGGACAALISIIEFDYLFRENKTVDARFSDIVSSGHYLAIIAATIIGSVSFIGSMIAWGKLSGKFKDFSFKGQHLFNNMILFLVLATAVFTYFSNTQSVNIPFFITVALALVYGVFFVLPIGGADMPVVISLLNSFTGIAAASGGFLYNNKAMLTGGILVGAAGSLLTILMCHAMNRSLFSVLIGSFGGNSNAALGTKSIHGNIKEISLSDAAMLMAYAKKVMVVPGYGLAVAQAQHTCHELEKALEERGVEVRYAIHPVAGRMPGHMNVLLAEADVNYEKLMEMDDANSEFKSTDVVLVLGANDVVNPAANNDPSSPIYGMPILEVELAKTVIVNKRSMKPGYAGIENELFYQPKTSMLFGDAKKILQGLLAELKNI